MTPVRRPRPLTAALTVAAAAVLAVPVAASARSAHSTTPDGAAAAQAQAVSANWPPDPIVPVPPTNGPTGLPTVGPTDGPTPAPRPTWPLPFPTPTTEPGPNPTTVPGPTPAPGPAPIPTGGQKHGPAPTPDLIAKDGGYSLASTKITASGTGGGTIYYPGNARQGEKFGGIVTIAGFMEPGTTMDTIAKRLATHGFVVLVADAVTIMDQPPSRATELGAALKALAANTTVAPVLDAGRMAIVGHSMGGGGAVLAAAQHPELRAVLAVHPWLQSQQGSVGVPTMVIAGGADSIAPADQHADPIYAAITAAPFKGLLTATAGTHWAGTGNDPALLGRDLAFMKYFVDGDTRYKDLLCAPASGAVTIQSTCSALR